MGSNFQTHFQIGFAFSNIRFSRFLLLLFLATSAFAKRGITPEDYFAFENIADLRLSPDGHDAACVLGIVDQKKNRRASSIWLIPADGPSEPCRLTAEGFDATSPRFRPDGTKLAFLSTRNTDEGAYLLSTRRDRDRTGGL